MEPETKVDEFLEDLKEETPEEDLFQTTEKKEKDEEPEKKEPEKIPFHKDPKIQRYIQKEIEKKIPKEVEPKKEITADDQDLEEILTRVIGNDTPERQAAIRDWKKMQLAREERMIEKAKDIWEQNRAQQLQEEAEAEEELIQGFESIEDSFNVDLTGNTPDARKLRAEFVEFIEKVAPKDKSGDIIEYPDFEQTFEIFQSTKEKKTQISKAKDLASRGTGRSTTTDTTKVEEQVTWDAVDKLF